MKHAGSLTLAIFHHPLAKSAADMAELRRQIQQRDPGVRVGVFDTTRSQLLTPLRLCWRPTVTVELDRPAHFNLLRGTRLRQRSRGKLAISQQLRAAGLPVPLSVAITPSTRLDPAQWGPYVVVKPDKGGRGAYVRIQRTGRVRHQPADHPGRRGPCLAEQFIYTGPWPVSHRVLTLFGEPLLALRFEHHHQQPALAGPADFRQANGACIVASAAGCDIRLVADADLLELARRVHALFPTVPLLGQDIVREAHTGRLYVLETNPNGATWLFSNRSGRQMQAQFGLDFRGQFAALPTAAEVLIRVARQWAR